MTLSVFSGSTTVERLKEISLKILTIKSCQLKEAFLNKGKGEREGQGLQARWVSGVTTERGGVQEQRRGTWISRQPNGLKDPGKTRQGSSMIRHHDATALFTGGEGDTGAFPDGSFGEESACSAGDPASIPGLGR